MGVDSLIRRNGVNFTAPGTRRRERRMMSNENKNKLPFPARDIVTNNQLSSLIQIGSFALHSLRPQPSFDGTITELEESCKTSAEALFLQTCNRLDDLLADTDRWSFKLQDSLEVELQRMYTANTKFLEAQTKAANQINLPSFVYKPSLVRVSDGEWLAHLGDLSDLDNSVVGIGATPEQAVQSFNAIFTGDPLPDHLVTWLAERELAANTKPVPVKKNENQRRKKGKEKGV